ncbi:MAG: hypothetical protein JNM56_37895 [Planctomycetia bacterium]|nr:hypothetical protein [Planctomycetia bacterium]
MRTFGIALVALFVLLLTVSPALACINDSDTFKLEKQFKSLYPDAPQTPPPSEAEPSDNNLLVYGGFGLGAALLLTTGLVGFLRLAL